MTVREEQAAVYDVYAALRPSRLVGIPEKQVSRLRHLSAHRVAQGNVLRQNLRAMHQEGKGSTLLCADRRRRLGFEANGTVRRGCYFGNLTAQMAEPRGTMTLEGAIVGTFGNGRAQYLQAYFANGNRPEVETRFADAAGG